MLKLSAQGDYGLMFLGHLAQLPTGKYVSLSTVAKEHHLPLKYLEHIVHQLVQHGLVESRQGKVGGYALARPARDIKLTEALAALEQGVEPVRCTHDGNCCERRAACEFKTGYQKVHAKLYHLLSQYTLVDISPSFISLPKP